MSSHPRRGPGFAESARSQPGLVGAFFIDAIGTGMFLPFSLLFFQATTPLPLARIGLGLSVAALVRIPVTIVAGPLTDRFGPRAAVIASQLLQAAGFAGYLFVHGFWQLVAAAVSRARGLDPDRPRNLTRSVILTPG